MKLEINYKKKNHKFESLNSMLLNNHWADKVKSEIKKCLETNENGNTAYQNLCDSVEVLRGKFIAMQAYFKKQKIIWSNLTFHLKKKNKKNK